MGFIASLAQIAQPVLNFPAIRRIRRNHGLEHATIHMLTRGRQNLRMAGRSDYGGFFLYGDVTEEEIARAVEEALQRMRAGQYELAVHPNCGTNLLTTGTLTTAAALLGAAGADDSLEHRMARFPTILVMVIAALLVAPGMGMAFQRHFTTMGDPGDLQVTGIHRTQIKTLFGGQMVVHRVNTARG
jgi:hypothetical protein